MDERVKVGVAAATLAPGGTGYHRQSARMRTVSHASKVPSAERFASAVAYYYYHHHHHHHHPSLRQTPTSRISAYVTRMFI